MLPNEGRQWLAATMMKLSDTEAQIVEPHRHVGVLDFAIEGRLPLSSNPGVGRFLPRQLVFTLAGYQEGCGQLYQKRTNKPVPCSRRRLQPLSTLSPFHGLAAMLASCNFARCLFSVSLALGQTPPPAATRTN